MTSEEYDVAESVVVTDSKKNTPGTAQIMTSAEYDSDNSIEVTALQERNYVVELFITLRTIGGSGGASLFATKNGESFAISKNCSWC